MPTAVVDESTLADTARYETIMEGRTVTGSEQFHSPREFVCGWGAALINISITFPINKAQFRQQLHGISLPKALRQLHKEGLHTLYRGILPPLLQKTTGLALMFGMYDEFLRSLHIRTDLPLVPKQFIAGSLSGGVEAILTPFERIQTLMQDRKHQGKYRNTLHAFTSLRTHGIKEYYRGLNVIIIRNGLSNSLFFSLRGPIRDALPTVTSSSGHVAMDFISGAVLGAVLSTIFFPLNVTKTRMQSYVGGVRHSALTSFKTIYAERDRSWRKMFLGVHVNYTRALVSWGVINAAYEMLRKLLSVDS